MIATMVFVAENQSSAWTGGLETKPNSILHWLQISTVFQSCPLCKNEFFLDLVHFKKIEWGKKPQQNKQNPKQKNINGHKLEEKVGKTCRTLGKEKEVCFLLCTLLMTWLALHTS